MRRIALLCLFTALPVTALAAPLTLAPSTVAEWKSVQATVETRDRIAARARLGGSLVALTVSEGDIVTAGQVIATLQDDKLAFQAQALDAQLTATQAQLDNAQAELDRGENLMKQGVTTAQRLDQLRTQANVLSGQIAALTAQRKVIGQQMTEGDVLAPVAGRVIEVPATEGAVLMPGEVVAQIAGGGTFLRLAVPERHAQHLQTGDTIQIAGPSGQTEGTLAKIYPLIQSGRVQADVEVPDLDSDFVSARVLVRLPVGERQALLVPQGAIATHQGLDFVTLADGAARVVVPGDVVTVDGAPMVEILSGLIAGDKIEPVAPTAATKGADQ